jgi:hypothetical protein
MKQNLEKISVLFEVEQSYLRLPNTKKTFRMIIYETTSQQDYSNANFGICCCQLMKY